MSARHTARHLGTLVEAHAQTLRQFAGYLAVSGGALMVDVAVYWSLLSAMHYAFLAAAGGYVCGVFFHYILSSRVVFRARFDRRGYTEEAPTLAKFYAAGLVGLAVTTLVVGLLADVFGLHPLLAKAFAAGCSFVVVFTTIRLFVFKAAPHARATA